MTGNGVADEMIEVDIHTQQIRDATAQPIPVVGDKIMPVDGLKHPLDVDDQVNEHEQIERARLSGELESGPGCQIAGDDGNGSIGPCVLDELNDFE